MREPTVTRTTRQRFSEHLEVSQGRWIQQRRRAMGRSLGHRKEQGGRGGRRVPPRGQASGTNFPIRRLLSPQSHLTS